MYTIHYENNLQLEDGSSHNHLTTRKIESLRKKSIGNNGDNRNINDHGIRIHKKNKGVSQGDGSHISPFLVAVMA